MPAVKTAKIHTAFLLLLIFNHDNTYFLIFSFQVPSKKKIKLGKQNVKSDARLGNLCKAVKRNTDPDAFPYI